MESNFLNRKHIEHYLDLVIGDHMHTGDAERASLFYIISGNDDLYRKRRFIYDPKDHSIKRCLDNNNKKLARNAIQIRFDSSFYYGLLE